MARTFLPVCGFCPGRASPQSVEQNQLAVVLVAVVGGIAVQRLLDPTIPAGLLTDTVRRLFRGPAP